jgi:hypothetical protein
LDVSANLRVPTFLEGVTLERKIESASFLGEHRRAMARAVSLDGTPPPAAVAPPEVSLVEELEAPAEVVAAEVVAPPVELPPPPPPAPVIDMSKLEAAIDRLRLLSERLVAEARSDVLELGLMVARKVVEGELSVNADRLIGVVKSAVNRVGESRRIVVHLAPEDVDLLQGGKPEPGTALDRLSRGAAKVEVVPDATLSRGDCVVEGDHLTVDARLDAKFSEIRRALLESAWDQSEPGEDGK